MGPEFEGSLCLQGRCVAQGGVLPGGMGGGGAGGGQNCAKTSECKGEFGQDAICRAGQCLRLKSDKCVSLIGEVDDSSDLVVAMLAPTSDTQVSRYADALKQAVEIAHGVYQGRRTPNSLPAPAVVVCDESQGVEATLQRLIDEVGVRVVLGPVLDQNLAAVLAETQSRGAIVVSPTIDDKAFVEKANDDGILWSCRRNRERLENNYARAFEHAVGVFAARRPSLYGAGGGAAGGAGAGGGGGAALRVVMVAANDPSTTHFVTAIEPKLVGVGLPIDMGGTSPDLYERVNYSWSPGQPTNFTALAGQVITALPAGRPNLVVVPTSIDDVSKLIDAIESAWPGPAEELPAYFIDEHVEGLASLASGLEAKGLRGRLLGLRPERNADTLEAYAAYVKAFKDDVGQSATPKPRTEYGFDCFFEITYALHLASSREGERWNVDTQGATFRQSIAALSGNGRKILISPGKVQEFLGASAVERNFDLVGSSGSLNYFNLARGYPDANSEIYCVDRVSGDFCGTGVSFSPEGELLSSGPGCQCEAQALAATGGSLR